MYNKQQQKVFVKESDEKRRIKILIILPAGFTDLCIYVRVSIYCIHLLCMASYQILPRNCSFVNIYDDDILYFFLGFLNIL
jgi:hypothetical protein